MTGSKLNICFARRMISLQWAIKVRSYLISPLRMGPLRAVALTGLEGLI